MSFSRRCVIVAAGPCEDDPGRWIQPGDLVIAADAGYSALFANGIIPDLIVGDFDSLDYVPDGIDKLVLPCEKDETDTWAAAMFAKDRGVNEVHILGGVGGRLDHTLANIQLIAYLCEIGLPGYLYDSDMIYTVLSTKALIFSRGSTGLLSVFSYTETASGVSLQGVRYPLSKKTLCNTFPLGVSNELTGQLARIKVTKGKLLVAFPNNIPFPCLDS